ncbi:MAG: SDR family NAD(P)-dependent oxidoreductase [Ilumatobacteraceae bacterium]|nr:SDR family NAD(P)-dependent oxidoreductase [Ilumatobacteraceae bacterium]
MSAAVARAVDAFDTVDVMVNNAGTMPLAFLANHAAAAAAVWSRCIDIKGVPNGMIAVHDQMMSQGRGHIVNLSSIYGNAPVVGILGQNAAEYGAAMIALSEGRLDDVDLDPESVGYPVLDPQHIVDGIFHAIDQPWGVSIGDITIRATGDRYVL